MTVRTWKRTRGQERTPTLSAADVGAAGETASRGFRAHAPKPAMALRQCTGADCNGAQESGGRHWRVAVIEQPEGCKIARKRAMFLLDSSIIPATTRVPLPGQEEAGGYRALRFPARFVPSVISEARLERSLPGRSDAPMRADESGR